jgi:hypothetical protein
MTPGKLFGGTGAPLCAFAGIEAEARAHRCDIACWGFALWIFSHIVHGEPRG